LKHRIAFALLIIAGIALAQAPIPFNTGDWEPFSSTKLPNKGCATELVAAICKAGGIEPSFNFYPWPRAEAMVESGDAFGAFPYAMNEARKAKFDFSEPLFYTTPRFIYHSRAKSFAKLKVSTLADMKNYSVAIIAGHFTENDLKTAGIKVNTAPGLENIVKMLQSGRVDFIVEEETSAFDAIKKVFPTEMANFRTLPNTFWPLGGNHLMVSKTYPNAQALLVKFNKGLQELKKNGVYKQITAKYNMTVK
jgi:polar amino acid transport system substrate-binding protein